MRSYWNDYNQQIDEQLANGQTNYSKIARDIVGNIKGLDSFRTYVSRRAKRKSENSIVDETLHRGNLKDDTWKVAWVKNPDTGVSALVTNPDYANSGIDYDLIRDDMVEEFKKLSPIVKPYKRKKTKNNHCLVLDIADLHIGKLSTLNGVGSNEEYNIDVAIKRALESAESLMDKSAAWNIDQVYFIIGNDVLHTDNTTGSTTKGTNQDTDGIWYDNFKIARLVYSHIIKKLSIVAPVHVIHCPSNHDKMTGFMLADAVSCYFHNDKNITFDVSTMHRKYVKYGKNLLNFSHGDGAKLDQVPYLAAHEVPQLWADTVFRYGYLHHIHHKDMFKFRSGKDFIGMTVEYLRSPSGADKWHSDKGYVGSKISIEAFIHHPTRGQVARLTHNF
ncbi:MAG: hypothetical protein ACJAS4_004011 [Bacteriovoracaceae bacterium]|jgi:hypothetical protein|tara:strand:+ start:4897 stop:6063 length:1167 start_codon:yes stop_codon:yes gene_type:complete